ncbi:hypothetical protein GGR02_001660 [Anoxybacillus voinovskiensis]|uniref:Spore germination protein n=1 Tax=Anoxybacteroides voinovskiense TaxID=230470 RepID=A0A840DU89_9BACL|nr:spore germination protein [Anoxybacillus voinovskiensis]MBB4073897.1 hypothetical protein [Anoxybacillus voinovskiensis]GGJ66300.1 hypothetical protein GCM10008982_14440 [Anoxybacillus voinovskiensis]
MECNLAVSEQMLRHHFRYCPDVAVLRTTIRSERDDCPFSVIFVYCEGLCDIQQFHSVILPVFYEMGKNAFFHSVDAIETYRTFPMRLLGKHVSADMLNFAVFNGDVLVYFEAADVLYTFPLQNQPNRDPEEPNTEVSVRGSKDGFIEEIEKNMALVRKRIKSHLLVAKPFVIGERTQTKVRLLYIADIINEELVQKVTRRLLDLKIDGLTGSTQLEELITEAKLSIFPLFTYTGRPDHVANALLNGRFALLVDGSPTAIIGPANLTFVLNTAEDNNTSFLFVMFQRFIRFAGLVSSIAFPGFWVALKTYHQDQMPFTLLATVILSRQGVPLPTPLEMFLILILFEVFKEAGMRLPMAIGQTLSVVGGLIVGQAAINAGLAAPGTVVMAAISLVATYTLVNQALSGAVTMIRFFIVAMASFLGMFGFIVALFVILLYLSNLSTFGIPYLTPLAPLEKRDIWKVFIPSGWKKFKKRPSMLKTDDELLKE